ncbi:hypothetical protein [Pleionea sp. CnH1-48]|uniref:hypothetical protein n=1 Tax=Pleionea sp. CnH1-48 TaxID=2954494 RepID=UPI0020968BE4|nr:hypothetical protein [Pleionea sp. CnH1-48]MCO7226023.1 hypothetical protein [Pleionea sp. CnH1-48]
MIRINSLNTLLQYMQKSELSVEWRVTSDIGPDWIGSTREIYFYLGSEKLDETEFHDQLKSALIKVANIPPSSEKHVIDGEGDVTIEDGFLKIKFWWSKAIPYQHSDESGSGEGVLFKI